MLPIWLYRYCAGLDNRGVDNTDLPVLQSLMLLVIIAHYFETLSAPPRKSNFSYEKVNSDLHEYIFWNIQSTWVSSFVANHCNEQAGYCVDNYVPMVSVYIVWNAWAFNDTNALSHLIGLVYCRPIFDRYLFELLQMVKINLKIKCISELMMTS